MKRALKISLKPNEKIYINGAVLRVDRKVSIELLNDVQFLLENHVLQAEDASTPLRQLYFIVQVMLMNPEGADQALGIFRKSLSLLIASFTNEQLRTALKNIDRLVNQGDVYKVDVHTNRAERIQRNEEHTGGYITDLDGVLRARLKLDTDSTGAYQATEFRNPQTGAPLKIPAKKVSKFVAGAELKKAVNRGR